LCNSTSGISIQVRAARDGENLSVLVEDNGPGAANPSSNGVGLENLKRRLQELYPGNHQLTAKAIPGAGFRVALRIPFRDRLTDT
jgi:LytS/YehU family sensor histidine kinase